MSEPASAAAPAPATGAGDNIEYSLFEVRKKIQMRSVSGWFAAWRWALVWFTQLVYYGLCWLPWNGRQAVLFDLVERKFYIFGLIFWPQDVIYLAILLIISAYALFLFTAIGGRLFCGYACPQTVYTEIFMWVEAKIEGDRSARLKLDAEPFSGRKLIRKAAKHGVWFLIALWTGFTFVGYFTPIRTLIGEVQPWSLGPWETFWIFFYGFATYGNAGWMREQVCKHMCPYARFQSVMFDRDTLIVTYDAQRGEPRGSRGRAADHRASGLGDCVDCSICVQVCPTGIDIRKGLQYECIGCSACIDGCDQVMDKMGYPRGLIRYSTERALELGWGRKEIFGHIMRPRIMIYSGILAVIVAAAVLALAMRTPLKLDVIRDRKNLGQIEEGGRVENSYKLQIMNTSEAAHRYLITVTGLAGIDINHQKEMEIPVAALTTQSVFVDVYLPPESGRQGSNRIFFDVKALDDASIAVHEKATFLIP